MRRILEIFVITAEKIRQYSQSPGYAGAYDFDLTQNLLFEKIIKIWQY